MKGRGLHSNAAVTLRAIPAEAGTGFVFRRTDLAEKPEIPARWENVTDTNRRVVLTAGEATVHTVEHVLAAAVGAGLDDAVFELTGPEPPAGDGSAALFHDAFVSAGIRELAGDAKLLRLTAPFMLTDGGARYTVAPADTLRLTVTIEWPHPLIGRQSGCYDVTPEAFGAELSRARTFGFVSEKEELSRAGLAAGVTSDNCIVLGETAVESGELRWPDEFVRHKALDLLGDLALTGARPGAEVTAFRPSHTGNVALARALARAATPGGAPVMGIEQILGVIPHRYPMLLVDRIIEIHGRERIVGIKNVTFNEPFFQGHFPGHPIMPGVLIVEAMAQVGGMLLMGTVDHPEDKIVYFMAIDNVKFRRPVVPGDQLRFELEMLQLKGRNCRMRGVAWVDGQPTAEAEMLARIVDR